MSRPRRCWGPLPSQHAEGCRLGRPLCRWRRREAEKYRVCECGAVPFPHRRGWCSSGAAELYMLRKVYGEEQIAEWLRECGKVKGSAS